MAGTTNEDTNPMFNERTINRDVYQPRLETIAELLLNEIAPGWKPTRIWKAPRNGTPNGGPSS